VINLQPMKDTIKPIIDGIKETLADKEKFQETISENLTRSKQIIGSKAKEVAIKNKDSHLVKNVVRPALESDKATKAIREIQNRLSIPLATKLETYRKKILDVTNPEKRVVEVVKEDEKIEDERPVDPIN
jgi:hypothetical protein